MSMLQRELTGELRSGFLVSRGLDSDSATIVNRLEPAISVTRPDEGGGRERMMIRSILPLGMVYVLLMSLIMSGSWMLQSTVEERGGKLIESVLACVSPRQFMYGKLLGTVTIGLFMVLTWLACALVAYLIGQEMVASIVGPALEPISSLRSVLAIVYFFVTGYVMVSLIFLVIGAISNSMQEAQGFLMPVMILLILPVMVLMQAIVAGSETIAVQILTWVPLFSPFAVLARLGSGIDTWEILGSGVVLGLFVLAEVYFLGRVFRASLLGGGRPSLKQLFALMRKESAAQPKQSS
jgi:ABC-type Na+ efflux pump permease subunit